MRADRAEVALARLLPLLAGRRRGARGGRRRRVRAVRARRRAAVARTRSRALAGDALVDVVSEPVPDGWERRWHEFLRPVRVGSLVVRPPWVDGAPDDLVIDPGVCFGAGTHPTTRLCLQLLQRRSSRAARCATGAPAPACWRSRRRGSAGRPVTAVEVDRGRARGDRRQRRAPTASRSRSTWRDLATRRAPWAPTVVANLTAAAAAGAGRGSSGRRSGCSRPGCCAREVGRGGRAALRAARAAARSTRASGRRWSSRVIRLAVRVAREHAEPVLAELLALVAGRARGARRRRRHGRVRALRRAGELPDVGDAARRRRRRAGRRRRPPRSRTTGTSAGATGTGRSTSARCACGRRGSRRARARSTS